MFHSQLVSAAPKRPKPSVLVDLNSVKFWKMILILFENIRTLLKDHLYQVRLKYYFLWCYL